mmetsp:Transcript_11454/g.27476  ORF Transcript_11454/g.27476 Transcript_11454/m.27476 type:complete len:552 (-) Transcript_11454:170-1825(-)
MASEDTPLRAGRVTIDGQVFKKDGQEIVLMGGNYVIKASPYYPPLEVVQSDAKQMAQGAKSMAYKPPPAANGMPRSVVPCVRLGALMEAAMPVPGTSIDAAFMAKLEATICAFRDQGVYVFLDMHQDAFSTTNGGEGYPWWVAADLQKRAGCCLEQCCCCCCFSSSTWSWCPESWRTPYLANTDHPLQTFCCCPNFLARLCNWEITTYDQDAEPWQAYSVGGEGNPTFMNVGNASIRTNNADNRWSSLITSAQVQNCMPRIYASAHNAEDKKLFFDPFVAFAKYLCSLWDKYENVIAVELMNEPPLGGLPNLFVVMKIWRSILSFQADVLQVLAEDRSIKCPIAIGNWSNAVEGESCCVCCLQWAGTSKAAMQQFQSYANQNRLILSFHWYIPPSIVSFGENIRLAQKNAEKLGGIPIYLSEFWEPEAKWFADKLAMAADLGCNATTYWQYADTTYTGQPGWYKYPTSVLDAGNGSPVSAGGTIDAEAWKAYSATVAAGDFWGAAITGARGAVMNVLELVPATHSGTQDVVPPWPAKTTPLNKPHRSNPKK